MKKLWVLSIRTSLPEECFTRANLKTTFSAFETFEDAKKAMRKEIKNLTFTKNTMFDGDGKISVFDANYPLTYYVLKLAFHSRVR